MTKDNPTTQSPSESEIIKARIDALKAMSTILSLLDIGTFPGSASEKLSHVKAYLKAYRDVSLKQVQDTEEFKAELEAELQRAKEQNNA